MPNEISKVGTFPSPLAPMSVKTTDEYGLVVAKAIQSQWFSGDNNNFDEKQSRIQELRSYANGNSNIDKNKQLINPTGNTAMFNLDWSNIALVPKFVKTILYSIYDNKFDIEVRAVDPVSLSEREKVKNELVAKISQRDFLNKVKEEFGIDMLQGEQVPDSIEEVDVYMNVTFRQAIEMAAEIVIHHSFNVSDFKQEITKEVLHDIIVCGIGGSKTFTDPHFGVGQRYVDPEFYIHSYARKKDFSNCNYMGEVLFKTISELKREANAFGSTITEKQYEQIAKNNISKYGNPASLDVNFKDVGGYRVYGYDDYNIPVLEFEYLVSDCEKYEKRDSKRGNFVFKNVGSDYKEPKKSKYNKETHEYSYENIYTGFFILNTDYIYGWRQKENIPRDPDNPRKASFSYKMYAPELYKNIYSSIVEKIIPYADQAQLAHLKMQQAIVNAAPDGYAVNLSALDDVILNGVDKATPLDIADVYVATGRLYYRQETEDGLRNSVPITPLPSTLNNIRSFIEQINFYISMIREVSGIVPERDGQMGRDQLVGVTKIAIQGSNNATGDINHAIRNITRRTAEETIMRIQDIPKDALIYSQYVEAVGRANMAIVDSMGDLPSHRFGIDITVGTSDRERLILEQDVSNAVANKELRIEDRYELLSIPNPKYAIQLLKIRRKKYQQEESARAKELSDYNAQAQIQSAQASEQAKVQSAQMIAKMEMEKEAWLFENVESKKLQLEYELKTQLEITKKQGDIGAAQVRGDAQVESSKVRSGKEDVETFDFMREDS